jgi:chromosome segregation ATPase
MPRKDRYANHLMTKHTADIGREMMKQWVDDVPGCMLYKINQGITSLVQLQYIPSNNENLSIIFSRDARAFDADNDNDVEKKMKCFKDSSIADEHYKFLTETCFKEMNGLEVYQSLKNKVNNTLETAQLKKDLKEARRQLAEKPVDEYDELRKMCDELQYENKKMKVKLSNEYNDQYEIKYNDCRNELLRVERELQASKNEMDRMHKNYTSMLEQRSSAGADEALLRDMAEWEKKKKKESSIVEKLEKEVKTQADEIKTLKDELKKKDNESKDAIKKKDEDHKAELKKYKKNIEKYKKQMLKMMASKMDDSDSDESVSTSAS